MSLYRPEHITLNHEDLMVRKMVQIDLQRGPDKARPHLFRVTSMALQLHRDAPSKKPHACNVNVSTSDGCLMYCIAMQLLENFCKIHSDSPVQNWEGGCKNKT